MKVLFFSKAAYEAQKLRFAWEMSDYDFPCWGAFENGEFPHNWCRMSIDYDFYYKEFGPFDLKVGGFNAYLDKLHEARTV